MLMITGFVMVVVLAVGVVANAVIQQVDRPSERSRPAALAAHKTGAVAGGRPRMEAPDRVHVRPGKGSGPWAGSGTSLSPR
jgi:hypothetical protein